MLKTEKSEVFIMDSLKKFFPISFKYAKDVANLIVGIIIYLVVAAVGGFVIWIASLLPLIGWLIGALGGLLDLYVVIGVVLQLLVFFKVIK
jgi:hypothetical protein